MSDVCPEATDFVDVLEASVWYTVEAAWWISDGCDEFVCAVPANESIIPSWDEDVVAIDRSW